MTFIRDTAIGAVIRAASGKKLLKYAEEQDAFTLPAEYQSRIQLPSSSVLSLPSQKTKEDVEATTGPSSASEISRKEVILVTWYSDRDPEKPQNWSNGKKIWVSTLLFLYTVAAYMGASIYTVSEDGVMKQFGVSQSVASLGLTLYVFGYGFAPMILSPLTEIPAMGRNPLYAITFCLFTILTIPAALVDNIGGLLVVRFLLGVFCSPALSTVGASYGDFISPTNMQAVIALWSIGASAAPVRIVQDYFIIDTHLYQVSLLGHGPCRCRIRGGKDGLAMECMGVALALSANGRFDALHTTRNLERCNTPSKSQTT